MVWFFKANLYTFVIISRIWLLFFVFELSEHDVPTTIYSLLKPQHFQVPSKGKIGKTVLLGISNYPNEHLAAIGMYPPIIHEILTYPPKFDNIKT